MSQSYFSAPDNDGLKRMMDASNLRHQFILNNISNAKTPGYTGKDLDFDNFIRDAREDEFFFGLNQTSPNHMPVKDSHDDSPFHLDGEFTRLYVRYKTPNEEEDQINLATNTITYRTATDLLARKYRLITTAIMGGLR